MKKHIMISLVLGSALLGGCASLSTPKSQTPEFAEQLVGAKTAKDHEAIAVVFEEEAQEARDAAAAHRSLAKTYRNTGSTVGFRSGFGKDYASHCEEAAKSYDAIAADKISLAQLHRLLSAQSLEK